VRRESSLRTTVCHDPELYETAVAAIASSRDRGLDPFLIAPETMNAGEVDCAKNELFLELLEAVVLVPFSTIRSERLTEDSSLCGSYTSLRRPAAYLCNKLAISV
jgi:hypothetical protein